MLSAVYLCAVVSITHGGRRAKGNLRVFGRFSHLVQMTPSRYRRHGPPRLQNLSHQSAMIGLTIDNVR